MAKKKAAKSKQATKSKKPMKKAAAKKAAPRKSKPAAKKKVMAVPPGYGTVTPHLVVRGAADAIAFYTKAFGAKEKLRMPMPDGSIAHAEIKIGTSIVMLGDESPEMGASSPQSIGGTPATIFLYVNDARQWFDRAVAAGATVEMPLQDMFWGDRYGKVADPFGHKWSIGQHIEDVSPKEMARRMAAMPPPGSAPDAPAE